MTAIELAISKSDRTGPIVEIDTSEEAHRRALLLADMFLGAAAAFGWTLVEREPQKVDSSALRYGNPAANSEPPKSPFGRLLVDGERIDWHIEERYDERPHTATDAELARKKRDSWHQIPITESFPTGALRLVRETSSSWREHRKTWYDNKTRKVENQIAKILLDFYDTAMAIKVRRAEEERVRLERERKEKLHQEREVRREAQKS